MARDPGSSGAVHDSGIAVPVEAPAVSRAGAPGAPAATVAARAVAEGWLTLSSPLMARTR